MRGRSLGPGTHSLGEAGWPKSARAFSRGCWEPPHIFMLAGQSFYFGQLSNEVHSCVRTGNPGKSQSDTILSARAHRMPVKRLSQFVREREAQTKRGHLPQQEPPRRQSQGVETFPLEMGTNMETHSWQCAEYERPWHTQS